VLIGTGLVTIYFKLFMIHYLFLFLSLSSFSESSTFIFWVLCGICINVLVTVAPFIRLSSVVDLRGECDLVLVLAKFWCNVCYTVGFFSTTLLSCSSCVWILVCILLAIMVLVSQTHTSSNVLISITHSLSMEFLFRCTISILFSTFFHESSAF